MIGVVAAKDLPAEPSEEEFRLGLRSGIILCNVLNKVQPGAVPKVSQIHIWVYPFFGLYVIFSLFLFRWLKALVILPSSLMVLHSQHFSILRT